MGGEGDGGSEKRGEELLGGRELRGSPGSEQGGDGNAHEGVEGAPKEIECGDFISGEFDGEERCAGGEYRPGFKELAGGREREVSKAGEEAEGSRRGVDIQSGGEGDRGQEGEEFGERNLQPVGHGGRDCISDGTRALADFLSPLPGLWLLLILYPHGLRHGLHSLAAPRLW